MSERKVIIYTCETCGREEECNSERPQGVASIKGWIVAAVWPENLKSYDFCSRGCLVTWALKDE